MVKKADTMQPHKRHSNTMPFEHKMAPFWLSSLQNTQSIQELQNQSAEEGQNGDMQIKA